LIRHKRILTADIDGFTVARTATSDAFTGGLIGEVITTDIKDIHISKRLQF
jgi:hypothetical protein